MCGAFFRLRAGNGKPAQAALRDKASVDDPPVPQSRPEGASPIKPAPLGPDRGALTFKAAKAGGPGRI